MKLGNIELNTLTLSSGGHTYYDDCWSDDDCYTGEVCLMEACSLASGEREIDEMPLCTNSTLARIGIALNDSDWTSDETRTRVLAPLIPLLIKTRAWSGDPVRKIVFAMLDTLAEYDGEFRVKAADRDMPMNRLSEIFRDGVHAITYDLNATDGSKPGSTALLTKLAETFREALER